MSILGPFRSLAHLAGQAFAATLHGAVHARIAQAFAGFGAMGADAEVGEPAEQSCECWPVENPWTYYGIPEPGGALEYNPDCPEHGKDAGARFTERLADTAAAGLAETLGVDDPPQSPAATGLQLANESIARMAKASKVADFTKPLDASLLTGASWPAYQAVKTPNPDRLDRISAQLEDIRNLLCQQTSAESLSPDAADDPAAPTPTPGAAGSPTLGNDPGAVHERRMRQLTDEDRSTTK